MNVLVEWICPVCGMTDYEVMEEPYQIFVDKCPHCNTDRLVSIAPITSAEDMPLDWEYGPERNT